MKRLLVILTVAMLGCNSLPEPGPVPTGEGDLRYLIGADPSAVTSAELLAKALDADERIAQFHVSQGIYWQAIRVNPSSPDPDLYGSGGDSLLFTGVHLANRTFKYAVTRSSNDLKLVSDAVRGLYILTHISGTPGVMARCAFPADQEDKWGYPTAWQGRIEGGFIYESPAHIADPLAPGTTLPRMIYYTRVTRDQVSGLFYGLSVLWATLDPGLATTPEESLLITRLRGVVATIVEDVWWQLRNNDFTIVDHTGRNDTGADSIDNDLLRLQLLALYRKTVVLSNPSRADRVNEMYRSALEPLHFPGFWAGDLFNRFSNGDQYYAWNLRFYRSFSVWLLADADDKVHVADYMRDFLFKHVANHRNAFFSMTYAAVSRDADVAADAVLSLKSWSLRPVKGWCSPVALGWNPGDTPPGYLTQAWDYVIRVLGLADDDVLWPHLKEPATYFVWQKEPWDNGVTYPTAGFDGVSIDFSIVYWMGARFGLLGD